PDSTEVWVDLIEGLVEDQQLAKADKCLREQEARLLQTLEGLKADMVGNAPSVQKIETLINRYKLADGPIALLETTALRTNSESIEARLAVFKEVHAKVQELAKTHTALNDAANQKKHMQDEQAVLQAERAAGAAMPSLAARLAAVTGELNTWDQKVQRLIGVEQGVLGDTFVTQFDTSFTKCRVAKDEIERQVPARAAI
ncbi:MAG: hypothetical protein KBD23_03880, partial [Gammaproteobacteria bacterium]|nr:hypothetical protein [Gammaproteobacteria bacterium]